MIKCISYWSMENGLDGTCPIADALRSAKDHGFEGMELCIGTEGVLTTKTSRSECEAIRTEVNKSGVVVETLASGMSWACNPVSDDASVRERALMLNQAAIERTAWLGCQALLIVPGVVKTPTASDAVRYDVAVQRVRDTVAALLETAERLGIDLCLENVWNGLFYSPLELAAVIDSFDSDRLGVYFDVGNLLGYHQHPPHWISILGKRIKRVHIKDFKADIGNGTGFCDLLAGDVPWRDTVRSLREIKYERTVVAEMMPWDETLLERTSIAMDEIFSM